MLTVAIPGKLWVNKKSIESKVAILYRLTNVLSVMNTHSGALEHGTKSILRDKNICFMVIMNDEYSQTCLERPVMNI